MSLWQFTACVEGWNRAQGDVPEAPTEEEFDAVLAEIGG